MTLSTVLNVHLIDAILVLVLVEAAVLSVYLRRHPRVRTADLLCNLAAGFFLLAALRAALAGAGWVWICACLLAALVSHGTDLARRLGRP